MPATARKAWNDAMKATAGAALPPALQAPRKRRSDRHKDPQRRQKARKATLTSEEDEQLAVSLWIDALEGVDPNMGAVQDEEEEYDELEEHEGGGKPKKRGRKSTTNNSTALPKRFLPRSLASILMEEASRPQHSVAQAFLKSQAFTQHPLPPRKFCPVTGLPGIYKDPKTGIAYASLKALEQIHERSPPWMTLTGVAAFSEAANTLMNQN
ncbi:hypothetical protein FisN_21Hh043 [Fistulifera solaris]|uniref:Vps72/YL1 C-terminal domain-containing protein n=1 Tax=Fistulifera solaris TaxID=1519565 RepID=A0A1Z5KAS5_FISSO|nr:hypothetical protein FisN_21Hh043 [Fistulifera solaris]|eukprot:GAX23272.1 hypothetical protein FisN_21Hh043 [Fistulifera solaris]